MPTVEYGVPSPPATNWVRVVIVGLTEDQLEPAADLILQLRVNYEESASREIPEAESSLAPELVFYVPTDSADDPAAQVIAQAAVKKAINQVNLRLHIAADGRDPLNRVRTVEWTQLTFRPGYIRIGAVFVARRTGSGARVLNEIDVAVKAARDAFLSIVGGTSTRGVIPKVETDGTPAKSGPSRPDGIGM